MFDFDFSRILEVLTYNPQSPMIFSSGLFLILFLFFSLIYWILGKQDTLRIAFVTLFSYYFYYKSSGMFVILLAFVTTSDYYIARLLARHRTKWLVALSVLIDLTLLGYFKYTNFLGEILTSIGVAAGSLPQDAQWTKLDIFLPVGISFFTFQSLSYTIDVYRGQIRPLDRLLDYAFYVSFFPQLVAGPIVRAKDFIPQIRAAVAPQTNTGAAVFLIVAGLFKKAVISDYISLNFVERIFDQPDLYSGIENLLAVYGYTLQIYCDFSGYSDMAIGIALLLGFKFPKNFDNPYKSLSITEFWRRWHISLSSWLKDYLYISLGGNRHGKLRQYINLLITMLLGGLWHGASLNFIIWGGAHGLLLCLDKAWNTICPALSPLSAMRKKDPVVLPVWVKVASGLITFHCVCALWILFRARDFETASMVFTQIFTNLQPQIFMQWVESYAAVAFLMTLGFALHFVPQRWSQNTRRFVGLCPLPLQALLIVIVIFIVIQIKSSDVQPFIYFQF